MGTQAGENGYGAALRAAMARHDPPMSVSELSRSASLTRQAIRDILDGKTHRPGVATIGKIERVLGPLDTASLERPMSGQLSAPSGGLSEDPVTVHEVIDGGQTATGRNIVRVKGYAAALGYTFEVETTYKDEDERQRIIEHALRAVLGDGGPGGGVRQDGRED